MTVILGGGITGLSAAFYACERNLGRPILLEGSSRLGGWIRSVETPTGALFEMGPRMIRPRGEQGKNTLALIESLDLQNELWYVPWSHPTAKNRMIYVNDKLHVLPNSLTEVFKKFEPFDGPMIKAIFKDLTAPKVISQDESIYSFVERRAGQKMADYLISPMLCGICAGDAKQISVKFLAEHLFELEQKHGSIMKGLIIEKIRKSKKNEKNEKDEKNAKETDSTLAKTAELSNWALWGIRGGFEQLPKRLTERLKSDGADIRLNTKCRKITFLPDGIELVLDGEEPKQTQTCSRLVSSLSAKSLAPLLEHQHPRLADELAAIPCVDVAVVNLEFPGKCLPTSAFGFLVPPNQKNPILGVIFDSCVFPSETSTVLTVMMGGAWFKEHFGSSPNEEYLLKVALEQVAKILGIKSPPMSKNVAILKDCIAQHVVGHKQRIERIQNYISANGLPLALCGSSYQGIGVNDVILSAKQAVFDIDQLAKNR